MRQEIRGMVGATIVLGGGPGSVEEDPVDGVEGEDHVGSGVEEGLVGVSGTR